MHIIWELEALRKEICICVNDLHHWWNYFFLRKVFSRRFAPVYFFFNPLYSFTFLVWDGLNNAFDYWPIVVDDTCKYGVFEEVLIVKYFNPFVTQGKALCTWTKFDEISIKMYPLYPNICNKTPENYTQIYAVRKWVPKCAYLSRTEIRLTRVTIVC
jgi:hypothetical protein